MIIVHHLNYSRSTRILWALEELGLPYDIVRYQRNEAFRAPPELGRVHPLGKAPVIQDGNLIIGESSVILTYINTRYGGGRLSPPAGSDAYFLAEEWLQYVESTAAFPIMSIRIGSLTGGLSERQDAFFRPLLTKTLDHIAHAVSGGGYLVGDQLTLADIQLSYLIEVANHGGLLEQHQEIATYLDRLKTRPAFKKAAEVGGPMVPPK